MPVGWGKRIGGFGEGGVGDLGGNSLEDVATPGGYKRDADNTHFIMNSVTDFVNSETAETAPCMETMRWNSWRLTIPERRMEARANRSTRMYSLSSDVTKTLFLLTMNDNTRTAMPCSHISALNLRSFLTPCNPALRIAPGSHKMRCVYYRYVVVWGLSAAIQHATRSSHHQSTVKQICCPGSMWLPECTQCANGEMRGWEEQYIVDLVSQRENKLARLTT